MTYDCSFAKSTLPPGEGIKGIDVWANFTEDENGKILVELRSSKYNVNQVAVKYGGGGHKFASGVRTRNKDDIQPLLDSLEEVCHKYKDEINDVE